MNELKSGLQLIALFFACLVVTYAWASGGDAKGRIENILNTWDKSEGVITDSHLECRTVERILKKDIEQCMPVIKYSYLEDGIVAHGDKINGEKPFFKSPEYAKTFMQKFNIGRSVEVFHPSNDRSISTLIFEENSKNLSPIFVLFLWVVFGVRLVFVLKK